MVVRTRLRANLRLAALYIGAIGAISYFAFHAVSGDHGLEAHHFFADRERELSLRLTAIEAERRSYEKKVALMRAESIDPDILDEKTRQMLGKVEADEIVVMRKPAVE